MKKLPFDGVAPFAFSIQHTEIGNKRPHHSSAHTRQVSDSHIHKECEIYINLSGDVSFMVENRLYPILPGSIVITRPYEYHHCVYHSNKPHSHFWILFSCEGNEDMLDLFFKRKPGENNLLSLPPEETEELIALCHRLTNDPLNRVEKYYGFFRLLTLLEEAESITPTKGVYPDDILIALHHIGEHFAEPLSIHALAEQAHVSVNTLERHFKEFLHTSPSRYLQKTRLANSVKLLSKGSAVTTACTESGFTDCSSFISLFKKTYGATPLQYQKSLSPE